MASRCSGSTDILVRVVILASEKPHKGRELSPTMVNILQEYVDDLHHPWPARPDLSPWARQGVIQLDLAILPEEELDAICGVRPQPVFLLWGLDARTLFGTRGGCVYHSAHPAARRGFRGSRPFSTANALLRASGLRPVDWKLQ